VHLNIFDTITLKAYLQLAVNSYTDLEFSIILTYKIADDNSLRIRKYNILNLRSVSFLLNRVSFKLRNIRGSHTHFSIARIQKLY